MQGCQQGPAGACAPPTSDQSGPEQNRTDRPSAIAAEPPHTRRIASAGSAVVKEALSRGLSIRAVVRDDRDVDQLPKSLDLADLSYADPTSLGATKLGCPE